MRYIYYESVEDDCLTLTDNEEELKASFESEIILYPLDGAIQIIDKLNWYELLIEKMKDHLTYYGFEKKDFDDLIEEVELDLESG